MAQSASYRFLKEMVYNIDLTFGEWDKIMGILFWMQGDEEIFNWTDRIRIIVVRMWTFFKNEDSIKSLTIKKISDWHEIWLKNNYHPIRNSQAA